ncbi:hypothetical protein GCM10011273_26800 [Asticcacaulis endophyticus]|uniref:Uncharacterized protein n=1 Tax=Asticcacaulis endophyticus TaxID=1395890 RepID=A0A918QA94_9CAUL|nr:hypothetical protein GCM10011273_26800 [Asticcacaulis endophyticus]
MPRGLTGGDAPFNYCHLKREAAAFGGSPIKASGDEKPLIVPLTSKNWRAQSGQHVINFTKGRWQERRERVPLVSTGASIRPDSPDLNR